MKSLNEVIQIASSLLPLRIISVKLAGEQLIIMGEDWSMGFATSWWRVVQNGVLLFGYEEYNDGKVRAFEGVSIVEIKPQSNFLKSDIAILLSNNCIIETFSTSSLEPWSITVKGQTFFADPSDFRWTK